MSIKPIQSSMIFNKKLSNLAATGETTLILGKLCSRDEAVFSTGAAKKLPAGNSIYKVKNIVNNIKGRIWKTQQ